MDKRVAIVVPCYNEEFRFPTRYWSEILKTDNEIHWLFVDDGSTDQTFDKIKEACMGTTAQMLQLKTNHGKGNAIRKGFLEVLTKEPNLEFLGYIDSDGAFSKNDIFKLAETARQRTKNSPDSPIDALISSRVSLAGRQINRKINRHYLGRIVATLLTRNWQGAPYDTQSGYKLFLNSQSFKNAIQSEFKTKWFVDIELLTRIGIESKGSLNIWEEPLFYWNDVDGSKLGFKNFHTIVFELLTARRQVFKLIQERKRQNGSH